MKRIVKVFVDKDAIEIDNANDPIEYTSDGWFLEGKRIKKVEIIYPDGLKIPEAK